MVVHIGTRPVKNPQISIEAIKSLRRRRLSIKLVIVGAPTTVPKEDGIEERFGVSEKEKLDLLCRAKALIRCRRRGAGALYAHRREVRREGGKTRLRKRAA